MDNSVLCFIKKNCNYDRRNGNTIQKWKDLEILTSLVYGPQSRLNFRPVFLAQMFKNNEIKLYKPALRISHSVGRKISPNN